MRKRLRNSHLRLVGGIDLGDPPTPAAAARQINEIRHQKSLERIEQGLSVGKFEEARKLIMEAGKRLNLAYDLFGELLDVPDAKKKTARSVRELIEQQDHG